jgi:hypothetical protein
MPVPHAVSLTLSVRLRRNSHAIISFADPHHLNSVVSYRYKNAGGGRVSSTPHSNAIPLFRYPHKSFCLNLFADPRPINRYDAILYKNSGGRWCLSRLSTFQCSTFATRPISLSSLWLAASVAIHSSILRTNFQVPIPASPLFAALTKTPGVWGYSSHSGTLSLPFPSKLPLRVSQ